MIKNLLPLLALLSLSPIVSAHSSSIPENHSSELVVSSGLKTSTAIPDLTGPGLVQVVQTTTGFRLEVDGQPFFINGMNWDYFPIGTNYNYSLWNQPDELIKSALDNEMTLLKNMGVNAVRMYTGVPARWIQYIYETHGIYTMLNHSFGRYGLTLDGNWFPNT
ncbi:MAG: hypothetical protein LPK45_06615, partial [Bacteroidota bacterium]|nr:hypothetical protein [Bacteroidota bacterium]MDX5430745.1 hypothetical protein [Bacteroidota bacterium]MDX5469492.1 hypothetical protein [Bacteroidota bacterium]